MNNEFTKDDFTYILTQLRDRLVTAEKTIAELKDAVHLLNYTTLIQQRMIMALQGQLTQEGLTVLSTMEDVQLDQIWWNAMPNYVAFTKELEQVLRRGKSAS